MKTKLELFEPEWLDYWTMPRDYFGEQWNDYYRAGVGKHRDSDSLQRANFRAMLNALGFDENECAPDDCPIVPDDSDDKPTRTIVRADHWAVGWIEWIAIHETDKVGLIIADEIIAAYQDYPVIDEVLYSEYESVDCEETWKTCYSDRERLAYIREHSSRSETAGVYRVVRAACAGSWSDAESLLDDPSAILS